MVERGFVISEPEGHQADRPSVTLAPGMSAALRRVSPK
jgi:hypothetical protein